MHIPPRRFRPDYRTWIWLIIISYFAIGWVRATAQDLSIVESPGFYFGDELSAAQSADIQIKVTGMVAEVRVEQTFLSPSKSADGMLVFPLPDTAAVHRLRMKIADRVIEGEIQERQAARRTYEAAKSAGKTASLVNQERADLFTTRVANIPPQTPVVVELSYAQEVPYIDGQFQLRYPLAVPMARYDDDAPTAPPIQPRQSLSIALDAGFDVAHLDSSFHPVSITKDGFRHEILVDTNGINHDFEMIWEPVMGTEPKAALMMEAYEDEPYALLMIMPPAPDFESQEARELILVIDTSGSMHGEALEQAREALMMAVGSLKPHDRFNVIQFNSMVDALFPQARPASSEHIADALDYIAALEADGGTEMAPALETALIADAPQGFLRQVVFITDGAVGNEATLFSLIEAELGQTRLFTVGIGNAPNGYFMRKAAQFGRGSFTFIGSPDQVAERMDRLLTRLEHPVLSDVCVTWPGEAEAYPDVYPDLYAGEPLVVAAKIDAATGQVDVCGKRQGAWWDSGVKLGQASEGFAVATLWAKRRIESLQDERVRGADPQLIREKIVETSLRHRVLSEFTAFVAVDPVVRAARTVDLKNLKTDAGTVYRITLGLFLGLLGWVVASRLRDDH